MRLLAIDIGNSRIKVGLFISGQLEWVQLLSFTDYIGAYLNLWLDKYLIDVVALSNVNTQQFNRFLEYEELDDVKIIEINGNLKSPIKNYYKNPLSLGADRYAGVVGAHYYSPDTALLVIDLGTAITYDYVNLNQEYLGGGISPGMKLRFKALHHYTARLPFVIESDAPPLIGKTTQECIRSGVQYGIIAEIEGTIQRYKNLTSGKLVTFVTGGTMDLFQDKIYGVDYYIPDLVLEGMLKMVEYSLQNA